MNEIASVALLPRNDRILEFVQSFGLRGSGSKNRLQDFLVIFAFKAVTLAVGCVHGSGWRNFAVEFQAEAQKTAAPSGLRSKKVSPEQAGLRKALKAKITKS